MQWRCNGGGKEEGKHTLDGVRKGWVQVVDDLGEDIGRALSAVLVNQEDLQAPFSHREAFDGRLVTLKHSLVSTE